jgi:hypothetical protein
MLTDSAVGRLGLEPSGISQVLRPADRFLIADEIGARDHRNSNAFDVNVRSPCPRIVELQRVERREQIDSARCDADLDDCSRAHQIGLPDILQRRPETCERTEHTSRIVSGDSDPEIQVARGARKAMDCNSVRSDEQVLSAFVG